jgi:hypothetical protein
MNQSLQPESGGLEPEGLETLAAAYAEVDGWDDAVATQKLALGNLTGGDSKERSSFESRLQQYLKREKVRE